MILLLLSEATCYGVFIKIEILDLSCEIFSIVFFNPLLERITALAQKFLRMFF